MDTQPWGRDRSFEYGAPLDFRHLFGDGPEDLCSGPSGDAACEDSRLRHDSRFPDSVSADLGDSVAEDHLSPAGDEPPVY